jgi:hypothetical protein
MPPSATTSPYDLRSSRVSMAVETLTVRQPRRASPA